MSCQVKVQQGMLQGREFKTYNGKKYYCFEGIPYAKPPVGELRFKAPQPIEIWSGIKDATKPGNKCPQLNPTKGTFEGSEDCLYLNVYTPVLPHEKDKKLPIIFFIHGGRLTLGYGDYYRPDHFINQDIILVTINYRLNIFGFLCLDTKEVPGNAGLKDTVFALRWVNKNIGFFNGDVRNITVMGESAGAAIGASFLTSKMTDGLFDKLICQSGSPLSDLYIIDENVIARASRITEFLGEKAENLEEIYEILMHASAQDLVYAFAGAELDRPMSIINAFLLPVIEKDFGVERFFEESPFVVLKRNQFRKVPILASMHTNEAAPFLRKDGNGNIYYEQDLQYFIPRFLCIPHNTLKAQKFASTLHKYYFGGKKIDSSLKEEYLKLLNDHHFERDIILFLEMVSKHQKNVFLCSFGYNGALNTRVIKSLGFEGATHGDLLQYIFYRESKMKAASEKDLKIVEILVDAWCDFAKTGKPTVKNLDWQPYEQKQRLCLNVDMEDIKVVTFPNLERMKFWLDLIRERSKL